MNKIESKCKNCKLFDPKNSRCNVIVLHEGEKYNLPVDPNDECFFENEFIATDTEKFKMSNEIKEVKFWVEDPKTGEKIDGDGVVKIEYPSTGFFGKGID